MQSLILTLAEGEGYDEALEAVYGFNADGLEVAWRQAIGAPSRQIPPTPTAISAAAIPTIVPLNGAQSLLPPGFVSVSPTSDTGSVTTEITAVAVLTTAVPVETPFAGETQPPAPTPTPEASGGINVCGLGAAPLLGIGLVFFGRSRKRSRGKQLDA
jgi:hypothetical protein